MDLAVEELKELSEEMQELTGFDLDLLEGIEKDDLKNKLTEDFIIPPFSVWDTRQEYWQNRKRLWKKYFGDSREGREDNLLGDGLKKLGEKFAPGLTGTSEFDPVVAEICYRWFNTEKGTIIDPFAGGIVRGAVADTLGYSYTGIDLSKKQIDANNKRAEDIGLKPKYILGNSLYLQDLVKQKYDLIFSCPPYYDLEIYTENKEDLSNKDTYTQFLEEYKQIINKAVEVLKDNRFAIFVVGEIRNSKGYYNNFVADTIKGFEEAGAHFFNDIILVNAIGTLPIRARRPFEQNRKIGKVHQNILVFYKGDKLKVENSFKNIPKVENFHKNILVFYKGNIDDIRKNYKVVDTGIDKIE